MCPECAVVPGYYLVCYNNCSNTFDGLFAVVPGYYLVCYNLKLHEGGVACAVVPGYYLVCYNRLYNLEKLSKL